MRRAGSCAPGCRPPGRVHAVADARGGVGVTARPGRARGVVTAGSVQSLPSMRGALAWTDGVGHRRVGAAVLRVWIDALTWRLRGVDEAQLYSGQQLQELFGGLVCPACGAAVTVDQIPVDGSAGVLIGHWHCTGQAGHTSAGAGR